MKILFLTLAVCCSTILAVAQTVISYELQPHLMGINHGLRIDRTVSEDLRVFIRGGFNYTNRWDWGKKDEEIGSGSGFGFGYQLNSKKRENLSIILRADFWFMEVEWKDYITQEEIERICSRFENPGLCDPAFYSTGTTKTNVFQPTIGAGYLLPITASFFIKPSISLGREFNFNTRGEQVHQGTILLGGIQVGYIF